MKNTLAFVSVAALALAVQTVSGDVLVDRGLPSTGVYRGRKHPELEPTLQYRHWGL